MKNKILLLSATNYEHNHEEIHGIPIYIIGIGRVNAALNTYKLIQKYTNVPLKDLWKIVKGIYKDKGYTAKEALAQARVARILRHGDYNKKTGKVKLWQIR